MNPVLVFLIILAAIIVWLLASFIFVPLGKVAYKIYKDAIDEMNSDGKNRNE